MGQCTDGKLFLQSNCNMSKSRQAVRLGLHQLDNRVLLVIFGAIPLAFFDLGFGSLSLAGWTWVGLLVLGGLALATHSLAPRSFRTLGLYAAFLVIGAVSLVDTPDTFAGLRTWAQLVAPAVLYLLAWRADPEAEVVVRIRQMAWVHVGLAWIATIVFGYYPVADHFRLVDVAPLVVQPRPLALALVFLFIFGTIASPSRRSTLLLGVATLGLAWYTGSRMASVVLLFLFLSSPDLRLRRSTRAGLLGITGVSLLFAVTASTVFQNRLFFTDCSGGLDTLLECVASGGLRTSGRAETWPDILEKCAEDPLLGSGIGASQGISQEASGGALGHPHNEYIRAYCDTGVVGSIPLWGFMLLVAHRGWHMARRRANWKGKAALQAAAAILFLSITDNVLVYTLQGMVPAFMLFGWLDHDLARAGRRSPPPVPESSRDFSLPIGAAGT